MCCKNYTQTDSEFAYDFNGFRAQMYIYMAWYAVIDNLA